MTRWVVLGALLCVMMGSTVQARRRRVRRDRSGLWFQDCGTNPTRPVNILQLTAHPMPVIVPGTLRISASVNITYDIPRRLDMHVTIKKRILGFNLQVPCFGGVIGSCTYHNVCYILEPFETEGCPRVLSNHNVACHCPFIGTHVNVHNLAINLPRITGAAAYIIQGNYEAKFRLMGENNVEMACLKLKVSVKKRNRGWFFRV